MSATLRVSWRAARTCVLATATLICAASIARADDTPPYCAELKQVAALVLAKDKFASIIGAAREGNFLESKVTLSGWGHCSMERELTLAIPAGSKPLTRATSRMRRSSRKSNRVFAAAGPRIQVEPRPGILCCTTKGSWPRSLSTPTGRRRANISYDLSCSCEAGRRARPADRAGE
jgi:hypothetical protein